MEFIFQVLAEFLSPVDEENGKIKAEESVKEQVKEEVLVDKTEKVETEDTNLFGMVEFH
ncbi:hypothetical protein [Carboxylicivirga sp. N1Y90]|uniref:hypothetical protein n=1 Tax=Carboxylicivirga fragile TaxID=3417571 RepID=UPI003D35241C|nr:hypothetical protein [Marinilabiliaceae bacterium N1Y90]